MFFDNFTIRAYKEYLLALKENHSFINYNESLTTDSKFVILRHDIDFSINNSLKLAEIEFELGTRSTFFVHLHSEYYNFLDFRIQKKLFDIIKLGHSIELHLCCDYYDIRNENQLLDAISSDLEIFEKHLGIKPKVFSFHNPTPESLKLDKFEYCGLINTYSTYFKENTVYASDSNGYWRHKSIGETIKENLDKNLHILTHPVWWTEEVDTPRNKIEKCLNDYAIERMSNYDQMLFIQGRKNIK